jgi:hypothetical protein
VGKAAGVDAICAAHEDEFGRAANLLRDDGFVIPLASGEKASWL